MTPMVYKVRAGRSVAAPARCVYILCVYGFGFPVAYILIPSTAHASTTPVHRTQPPVHYIIILCGLCVCEKRAVVQYIYIYIVYWRCGSLYTRASSSQVLLYVYTHTSCVYIYIYDKYASGGLAADRVVHITLSTPCASVSVRLRRSRLVGTGKYIIYYIYI
jgi:hypothetical protein